MINTSKAQIIKDEKTVTNKSYHSFKEACKYLTKRESPLIDFSSISKLNCMGEKKDISDFCDYKEQANPYYIRAIANEVEKRVECISAKKVIIKYKCREKKDPLCEDAEIGCFKLREKLAKRLSVTHNSLIDKTYLNCYFEIRKNILDLNL